jgi:hypothetical protein
MAYERCGDHSHSKSEHICSKCQCRHTAGYGTHGDLYGLGFDTGHYGTGMCFLHEDGLGKKRAQKFWIRHMEAIRTVGYEYEAPEVIKANMELEAHESQGLIKARKELSLIQDTLDDFRTRVSEENLKTYVNGKLVAASDVDRMTLAIKLAEAISKLDLNHLKMDADNYLHIDELRVRLPQMRDLGVRCFGRVRELMVENKPGDPVEIVTEEWLSGLLKIWQKAKTGMK